MAGVTDDDDDDTRPIDEIAEDLKGAFTPELAGLAHDLHALPGRLRAVLERTDNPSELRDALLVCIYDQERAMKRFDAFLARVACQVIG
jgi:hypothetical protein